MIIGVTGGMGCGKSTLCRALVRKFPQFTHVDMDSIRREILGMRPEYQDLRDRIGRLWDVQCADGSIDRRRLASQCHDYLLLQRLLRPAMQKEVAALSQETVLLDWALLIEDGLQRFCSCMMIVTCPRSVQIRRLSGGDLPEKVIHARIDAQLTDKERLKLIDRPVVVVDTSASYGRVITGLVQGR